MQAAGFQQKNQYRRLLNSGEVRIDVADFQRVARRRLPGFLFDFLEGDAEDGYARRGNKEAFNRFALVPRRLVDVERADLKVQVFGREIAMPLIIAPTALSRVFHPQGERAVAAAARRANIPYSLSTMASVALESVANCCPNSWFQLYFYRDRVLTQSLIERAWSAGYEVLCMTLDAFIGGNRTQDRRNGFRVPFTPSLKHMVDAALHPRWSLNYLMSESIELANIPRQNRGDGQAMLFQYVAEQMDPSLTWDDVKWVRDRFKGRLLLKGVLSVEDALKAHALGVDGLVLSNHGGRQLDHSISGLEALQNITPELQGKMALFVDGGIRRGTDIIKALCLGASACLIGRPYLYGLAARGETGVFEVLDIYRTELERSLKLLGCPDVTQLNPTYLQRN